MSFDCMVQLYGYSSFHVFYSALWHGRGSGKEIMQYAVGLIPKEKLSGILEMECVCTCMLL